MYGSKEKKVVYLLNRKGRLRRNFSFDSCKSFKIAGILSCHHFYKRVPKKLREKEREGMLKKERDRDREIER